MNRKRGLEHTRIDRIRNVVERYWWTMHAATPKKYALKLAIAWLVEDLILLAENEGIELPKGLTDGSES